MGLLFTNDKHRIGIVYYSPPLGKCGHVLIRFSYIIRSPPVPNILIFAHYLKVANAQALESPLKVYLGNGFPSKQAEKMAVWLKNFVSKAGSSFVLRIQTSGRKCQWFHRHKRCLVDGRYQLYTGFKPTDLPRRTTSR